jgi:Rrf2 family transcriptional regulator, nitric oxide-sensitive transcriptional repressor
MRLTLHTDFALRVLIYVGLNDGKLTTIKEIAQTFDISKAHLMKVVNDLSQKGYLDAVRGRSGGIRLMREPEDINIGQVVRDTENQLAVIGCLERKGYCPIERVCVLRCVESARRLFPSMGRFKLGFFHFIGAGASFRAYVAVAHTIQRAGHSLCDGRHGMVVSPLNVRSLTDNAPLDLL